MKRFFSFFLSILFVSMISSVFAEADIMEVMFQPAKEFEKILDLGSSKDAVGNEIFKQSSQIGLAENFGKDCHVNGETITFVELTAQKSSVGYQGTESSFCKEVLGGDMDVAALSTQQQAPLIVRITKFLLRLTMILSVTLVIYNGIMWIIESASGGEVKDAKKNLFLIIGGILVALLSVGFVNLVTSLSVSSIGVDGKATCQIKGKTYTLGTEELKKYLCEQEKGFNGKWYPENIGRSCRANQKNGFDKGKWVLLTEKDQISKCAAVGGIYEK